MNSNMRDLFEKIQDYEGDDLFNQLLMPWIKENEFHKFIEQVAQWTADINQIDNLPNEVIWSLYALSRVLDILTFRFQYNVGEVVDPHDPKITLEEYVTFAQSMGLTVRHITKYHPFDCEIVKAECGEPSFSLLEPRFPALMLNNLIIKRGGVILAMNPSEYRIDLMNNATIYWAYWRQCRPSQDQSRGWGSNSQWRTDFRFDFECENGFLYNAQGKINISTVNEEASEELRHYDISFAEARELTKYRHFITCTKKDDDLYPYKYKLLEPKK